MQDDCYRDAVCRLYDGSCLLYKNEQWLNSCYFAGLTLECYAKLLLDVATDLGEYTGQPPRRYSHNVKGLKDAVCLLNMGECSVSSYCEDLSVLCPILIGQWNVNMRYWPDTSDWNTKDKADQVQKEIDGLIEIVIRMQVDGVIV